jgi:uncharacterized protein (TIGR02646 family)
MIHVDRTRVKAPAVLRSAKAEAARKELTAFFRRPPRERAQQDPPFVREVLRYAELRAALRSLFHEKCAYCETPVELSAMKVDQFRPEARAIDLDGSLTADGYWWLAYEWSNLYAACASCEQMKGTRFPIGGERAAPGTRGERLAEEEPLLFDPCADRPEKELIFSEDGRVASRTQRGRVTIDVLGLNRAVLIESRRAALASLRASLVHMALRGRVDRAAVMALVAEDRPHAAAGRQFARQWLDAASKEAAAATTLEAAAPPTAEEVAPELPHVSEAERRETFESFQAAQTAQEAYSVADEGAKAKAQYFARTRLIDRIEVHNFRPIEDLDLRFPPAAAEDERPAEAVQGPGSPASWLMLLGENSSGKSSALQAAALALIGQAWRDRLRLDARRFVRHGATEGRVRVFLTGASEPIEMSFSLASPDFTSSPAEPKVLLLGYGATRLLPRAGVTPPANLDVARVDNLFNPFEPLNDASAWLLSLPDPSFDHIARALKVLLQLGAQDRLARRDGRVEAELFGTTVTLEELSDGYQSLLALTTDIMRVMHQRWEAMEVAEGIVVLDEIGSHLHPRWRMRVVGGLRQVFPRVQFLASTHDPLCLRGLVGGEVAVMRRDGSGRIVAVTDLPPVRGLRVDQLLTSEYFGLSSTVDPDLEERFGEYYRLLALRKPDAAQKRRIAELKAELDRYRVLGANRRERMMLEVIDEYLAAEAEAPPGDRAPLEAAARAKLKRIWDGPAPARSPAARRRRRGR